MTDAAAKFADLRVGALLKGVGVFALAFWVWLTSWVGQWGVIMFVVDYVLHWKYEATGVDGLDNMLGNYLQAAPPLLTAILPAILVWRHFYPKD